GRGSRLFLSSLRPGDLGLESMRWSSASLYAAGFELDWTRVSPPGRFIRLPNYSWRRQRYWLDQEAPPPRSARRHEHSASPELAHVPGVNGHSAPTNGTAPSLTVSAHANGEAAEPEHSVPAPIEQATAPVEIVTGLPALVEYLRERTANLLAIPPDQ